MNTISYCTNNCQDKWTFLCGKRHPPQILAYRQSQSQLQAIAQSSTSSDRSIYSHPPCHILTREQFEDQRNAEGDCKDESQMTHLSTTILNATSIQSILKEPVSIAHSSRKTARSHSTHQLSGSPAANTKTDHPP